MILCLSMASSSSMRAYAASSCAAVSLDVPCFPPDSLGYIPRVLSFDLLARLAFDQRFERSDGVRDEALPHEAVEHATGCRNGIGTRLDDFRSVSRSLLDPSAECVRVIITRWPFKVS